MRTGPQQAGHGGGHRHRTCAETARSPSENPTAANFAMQLGQQVRHAHLAADRRTMDGLGAVVLSLAEYVQAYEERVPVCAYDGEGIHRGCTSGSHSC